MYIVSVYPKLFNNEAAFCVNCLAHKVSNTVSLQSCSLMYQGVNLWPSIYKLLSLSLLYSSSPICLHLRAISDALYKVWATWKLPSPNATSWGIPAFFSNSGSSISWCQCKICFQWKPCNCPPQEATRTKRKRCYEMLWITFVLCVLFHQG